MVFELPFTAADFASRTAHDDDDDDADDDDDDAATALLRRFINESDAWRNSRLKLIPSMADASWWIKSLVGRKPALIGKKLDVAHHRGANYLEIDLDIGSSTIAQGIVGRILPVATGIAADIAFVVQGEAGGELPECILGDAQLCRLDFDQALWID